MSKFRWRSPVTLFLLVLLVACGQTNDASPPQSRLETVKARGRLVCGTSGELPGFSFVDRESNYSGLDVEMCRAIAAALFDDPDAVDFRNLSAKERFTALQSGQIDVLSRNTTWTLSRDSANGLEFTAVVFYDGQGIMVPQNSNIDSLEKLRGKSICVQSGTTTERNLADNMRALGIEYQPVVFDDVNITFNAYARGRCQAISADRSGLLSRRTKLPQPEAHLILGETFSKEPLAPAVLNNDSRWFDVVKWSVYATIEAEELGLTSANIEVESANSQNPRVMRFVGKEGALGEGLGLPKDFATRIIKHVGNYAEIYDRHLGEDTALALPRGQNKLWRDGGLLFSPPFR